MTFWDVAIGQERQVITNLEESDIHMDLFLFLK
jgi:hypothetical protein